MAIKYNIEFEVNNKTIKSQLASIQQDINKAFEIQHGQEGSISNTLDQAVKSAQVLEQAMRRATTVNGTSFVTLNSEIKAAGMSVGELVANLSSSQMQTSVSTLVNQFSMANMQTLALNKQLRDLSRIFAQSFKFTMAQNVLRFMTSTFQSGQRWSEDMNKTLTQISIVTEKTGADLDNIFKTLVSGARDLRVATREYAEASLIFYQQGLADDEVKRRTDTTIMAAKSAGQSVTEMSQQLTAVWNTYQMQGEQLQRAASIGAKLGADTAVDFAYIAEAMQASATAAAQMGVSYESLAAIIATVGETTLQSASTVGNAYKTIFSRFDQLKASGTDGEVTLGLISKQLDQLGIHILDASGELRDLDSVIQELGGSWDTYSQKQQIAIAEVVGGTRQFGQFLALMNNFDKYSANLNTALSENGATLAGQFAIWSDSIEAAASRANEAWAQVFSNVFDQEGMRFFYDLVANLGNAVNTMISSFGGILNILALIGAVFNQQILQGFQKVISYGKEMYANSTVQGQILNSNTKIIEAQSIMTERINNAQKRGNLSLVAELELGEEKLAASNKVNQSVIKLQNLQDKGNAKQKAQATTELETINRRQIAYFRALDTIEAESEHHRVILTLLDEEIDAYEEIENKKSKEAQYQKDIVNSLKQQVFESERLLAYERKNLEFAKEAFDRDALALREKDDEGKLDVAGTSNMSEALTKFTASAGMAAMGMSNLISMVKEGNISFLGMATQLAIVVPTLGALVKSTIQVCLAIATKLQLTLADKVATQGLTIAMIAEKIAVEGLTLANIKLLFSMGALLPYILGIVVAIGALILVGKVIVTIFQQIAANTPEAKLERAAKASGQLAEELKNVQQEAEDVKSTFADYNNIVDSLDQLTRGTEEWFAAIAKANDMVSTLINKMPELAKYISVNSDGLIVLSAEGQKVANQLKNVEVERARAASSAANQAYRDAQTSNESGRIENKFNQFVGIDSIAGRNGLREIQDQLTGIMEKDLELFKKIIDPLSKFDYETNNLIKAFQQNYDAIIENNKAIKQNELLRKQENAAVARQLLQDNEVVKSSANAEKLLAAAGATYDTLLQNETKSVNSMSKNQRAREFAQTGALGVGKDAEATVNGNGTTTFTWLEDGERITKEFTDELVAATVASSRAREKLDAEMSVLDATFNRLTKTFASSDNNGLTNAASGLSKFLTDQNFGQANLKEVGDVRGAVGAGGLTAKNAEQIFGKDFVQSALFLGNDAGASFIKAFNERLADAEEDFGSVSDITKRFGDIGLDAAKSFQKSFNSIKETQGDDAATNFLNALEASLEGLTDDERFAKLQQLSNIDFSFPNIGDAETKLNALAKVLDNLKTVGEKTQWLEDFNAQVAKANSAIDISNATFGQTRPHIEALRKDFLYLSEDTQKLILAQHSLTGSLQEYQALLAEQEAKQFDPEQVRNYMDMIAKVNLEKSEMGNMFADSLNEDIETLEKVAKATIRAVKAREEYAKSGADVISMLNSQNKLSLEYENALKSMRTMMGNILNVNSELISAEFITDPEHLALVEQALRGDEAALDDLALKYSNDIIVGLSIDDDKKDALSAELAALSNLEGIDIGATVSLDDSAFLRTLNEMLIAGEITEAQVNDTLSRINYSPTWSEEAVPIEQKVPATKVVNKAEVKTATLRHKYAVQRGPFSIPQLQDVETSVQYLDQTPVIEDVSETIEGEAAVFGFSGDGSKPIHTLTGTKKVGGTGNASKSVTTSPMTAPAPSSSSGGGGGSSQPKEPVTADYHKRYDNITQSLEKMSQSLKKVDAAINNAFGTAKLRLLARKNQLLQQQGKLYQDLYDENKAYLSLDVAAYQKSVAESGFALPELQFLDDGQVANAEQIQKELEAIVNTIKDPEAAEAAKKLTDGINNGLNKIQVSADDVRDTFNKMMDNVRTWFQGLIDEITLKFDLRVRIRQNDIEFLDYLIKKLGDNAVKTADRLEHVMTQAKETTKNMEDAITATNNLFQLMNNVDTSSADYQEQFEGQFGADAWAEFQSTGEMPSMVVESLLDMEDDILGFLNDMLDYNETIWGALIEALQAYRAEFDDMLQSYDNHEQMLTSMQGIYKATGKQYKDISFSIGLMNAQVDNNAEKVKGLKTTYDAFHDAAQQAEAAYQAELTGRADPEILNRLQTQLDEANKMAEEAQIQFLGGLESFMQDVAAKEAEAAALLYQEWSRSLNGIFSDIGTAMDMYGQKYTLDHFFMEDYDKQFELSKLVRQITKDMQNMTDPSMIAKYTQMIEDLNSRLADGAQITEKQLEIIKAEYDLEKERDAYQEQQAQKNTMRLARDTSGNWSYLYSNDGGEEEDNGAKMEEMLHNIQKMHRDAADQMSEMWLQLQVEMSDYEDSVDQLRYEMDEKYRNEVDTRRTWYLQQSELYASQVIFHNDAVGRSFEDTTLGVITDFSSMEEANAHYADSHNQLWETLKENHNKWQEKVKETAASVNMDYANMENVIQGKVAEINSHNDKMAQKMRQTADSMKSNINEILNAQARWANEWVNNIRTMIQACEDLIDAIQRVAREQAGMEAQRGDDNLDTSQGYTTNNLIENRQVLDDLRAKEAGGTISAAEKEYLDHLSEINDKGHQIVTDWDAEMKYQAQKLEEIGYGRDESKTLNVPLDQISKSAEKIATAVQDIPKAVQAATSQATSNIVSNTSPSSSLVNAAQQQAAKKIQTTADQLAPAVGAAGQVVINAAFPNVNAQKEIEDAFKNIANIAVAASPTASIINAAGAFKSLFT